MTLRLPEELDQKLEAIARARSMSKHAVIIEATERFVVDATMTDITVDIANSVADRYADLLRRLEDA